MKEFIFNNRPIGPEHPPLVIAEIGINHEGDIAKAKQMVDDAARAGAECVKFQIHVIEDEMAPIAKTTIPGNADVSIWEIMERCALTEEEDRELQAYTESKGMLYLATPFSRAAADQLERMGVYAYKIGSGECNNYPLIEHIANFGKPIILSTGMNDLDSIVKGVAIMEKADVAYALLHCTSMYPTPYERVRLEAITELKERFNAPVGLSDHSLGIYTCLGAVSLGACILEKHFTSDKSWPGPDVSISIDPEELQELNLGARAIQQARAGSKGILPEEQPTIDFAYASAVAIKEIKQGEVFTKENLWVKRPGLGIPAEKFWDILDKTAAQDIAKDELIKPGDIMGWSS